MRCFIAVDLPNEIKKELIKIQEKIKPFVKAKFVEFENFHLTLKFLGEISYYKINETKEKLKKVYFKKFGAKLGEVGVFTPSFVRVVWVSLKPENKIKELHAKIDDALEKIFQKDKRFESHVTLARIKKIDNKKDFLKKINEIEVRAPSFLVESFKLKKSILTSKGPIYEDIAEFPLA